MEVWNGCWVFAYGSLLWDPGFEYKEKRTATLFGYSRDMCMYSYEARGNINYPGLVLGLISGGHTHGMVFKVKEEDKDKIFQYLLIRENHPLPCYFPLSLPVHIHLDGKHSETMENTEIVPALCFVSDPEHEQFANLTQDKQIHIISTAFGKRGTSLEYLEKTIVCMKTNGITDIKLEQLLQHATIKFKNSNNNNNNNTLEYTSEITISTKTVNK